MGKNALVTGASSGIGKELARYHASKGGDLLLVARREKELLAIKSELESEFGVKVHVCPADLLDSSSPSKVYAFSKEVGFQVDYLINNAGFGGHGKFHERDIQQELNMVQVNISSLIALTHVFLKPMVERNSGKILNVASTAGFVPGPLQAVYYATKAFVLSFSQAIAKELDDKNIDVTALCPGAVHTGFVDVANLEGAEAFKKAATADSVAKCGYDAMIKGDLVKINDKSLDVLLNWVVPFLPRKTVLKMSQKAMEKS